MIGYDREENSEICMRKKEDTIAGFKTKEAMCQREKTYKEQIKQVNSERLKFHYFVSDDVKTPSFSYSCVWKVTYKADVNGHPYSMNMWTV